MKNPVFQISGIKPFSKNTLRGFFDLELADTGVILRGCTLHERDGKKWLGWLGRPYTKEDGSQSWSNIVDFRDNKTKYLLQDEVLPLVLAAMAEAASC
jgi:hypothetical protein